MDFLTQLVVYIESLSYMPSKVLIGLYDDSNNSVAVRPTPSNIDVRYCDKSKVYSFSFQVLVHNKYNEIAYSSIQSLFNDLDEINTSLIKSDNNSFKLNYLYCTTTPNHVQKTGYGTLYTALFNAELYLGG